MRIAGFLVLPGWALSALCQDAQRGRLMYETHCGACHYERLHDRIHTKIGQLADLRDANRAQLHPRRAGSRHRGSSSYRVG